VGGVAGLVDVLVRRSLVVVVVSVLDLHPASWTSISTDVDDASFFSVASISTASSSSSSQTFLKRPKQ